MATSRYKQNRLQQLRGFCYAARAQSISRAAERMFLSQPSVSLQIQALERELGTQLFTRRGPQIRLTADGAALYDLARPLVEGIDRLEERFADCRFTADRGTVTIAAGGSTIQYLLPDCVERFTRGAPRVEVRLCNVTGKAGLKLLREGEVDFAIGPLLERPRDVLFHPLWTCNPCLITNRNHPLAGRQRITLRDISRYPLILPPKEYSTYRAIKQVFAKHALEPDVRLEVGGYEVIKQYVRLNLGISIVMDHCLSPGESLFVRSVERYFPPRHYGLVLHRNRPLTPPAEQFVRTLAPDLPRTNGCDDPPSE